MNRYTNILIVDECRKTGSQSEAIISLIAERCPAVESHQRYCGEDVFIPLADASAKVMPDREGIIQRVLKMVGRS